MSPSNLLQQVEAFLSDSGMSPSKFGLDGIGDPGFVFGLRSGREPRLRTVNKVLAFISEQQRQVA